jgi:hypothetical protein
VHAPRGLDHEGVIFIAYITIARKLRELEERYRHKLMNEEERLKLRERILKLREKAAIEAGRRVTPVRASGTMSGVSGGSDGASSSGRRWTRPAVMMLRR